MSEQLEARSAEHLWTEYAANPSRRLRDQLVEQYRHLALAILRHMGHGNDEDLQQVALLSLVKAIDRFDPASGFRFSTFATPTIMGELKRYLRDHSRFVRPPRSLHDLHSALRVAERELTARMGRLPTLAEVADAMGVDLTQIVEAMALEEVCTPCSLHGLVTAEHERSTGLEECLGTEDPALARVEARLAWATLLDGLDPLLRQIIELRYYQNLTQRDAAHCLGVSQMQISRLERRALDRLRRQAAEVTEV